MLVRDCRIHTTNEPFLSFLTLACRGRALSPLLDKVTAGVSWLQTPSLDCRVVIFFFKLGNRLLYHVGTFVIFTPDLWFHSSEVLHAFSRFLYIRTHAHIYLYIYIYTILLSLIISAILPLSSLTQHLVDPGFAEGNSSPV